jgi:putative ABC transport system substrate-binding protein
LIPTANTFAILVNPGSIANRFEIEDTEFAANHFGHRLLKLNAGTESDIDGAFASAVQQGAEAFLVSADPFFTGQRTQIVSLAERHALPVMYPWREYPEMGGLMSYGTELTWAYGQIGMYAGRVLRGAKSADLPVQLPTSFKLVVNLKAAKTLGIKVPPLFLALADETIE